MYFKHRKTYFKVFFKCRKVIQNVSKAYYENLTLNQIRLKFDMFGRLLFLQGSFGKFYRVENSQGVLHMDVTNVQIMND